MIIWIFVLVFGLFITGYLAHKCFCNRRKKEIVHLPSDDLTLSLMHEGEKESTEPDVPLTALLGEREWKIPSKGLSPNSTWADIIPECRDLPQLKAVTLQSQNQQRWASDIIESPECDRLDIPALRLPEQHETENDSKASPDNYDWSQNLLVAEGNHENMPLLCDSGDHVENLSEPQVQLNWVTDAGGSSERDDASTSLAQLPEEREWMNGSDKFAAQDWLVNSTLNEHESLPFFCGPNDRPTILKSESVCQREQITEPTVNSDSYTSSSVVVDELNTLSFAYESSDSIAVLTELQLRAPEPKGSPGHSNLKISSIQSPNNKIREDSYAGIIDNGEWVGSQTREHGNLFIQDRIHGCPKLPSEVPECSQLISDPTIPLAKDNANILAMAVSHKQDNIFSTAPIHCCTNNEVLTVPASKQENLILLNRPKNHQSLSCESPGQQLVTYTERNVVSDINKMRPGYESTNGSHQSAREWMIPPSFPPENLKRDKLFIIDSNRDSHIPASFQSSEQHKYIFHPPESAQLYTENGNTVKL